MFLNVIYLSISKLSIKEMPVSEAPTMTILVLLLIFIVLRSFFVIIDNEKGASYWSNAFLSVSTPFLLWFILSRSSVW